ncbi:MAG: tetratricopeptide repeat protein [Myxococcales bacterium]|nr:tetratricopeptide repeat protein [Myxococcales bacterium]
MRPRLELALSIALLLGTLFVITPRARFDSDELLRLGAGRAIAQHGGPPRHDPLTFSRPRARWNNPEWLGDLVLYSIDKAGGASALVAYKLALLALGVTLALLLAVRRGAAPLVAAAVIALALLASFSRFSARNHLHAYWLLPLYGLLLLRMQRRAERRWLAALALLALGALWSTLHASAVLGWVCLAAAALAAFADRDVPRRAQLLGMLAALGVLHVLLPLLGPSGLSGYDQLLDHLQNGALYRAHIAEWKPTLDSPLALRLPLHALALVGLATLLARANRRHPGAALELLVAVALAHVSLRFVPLMAFLAAPAIAANLARAYPALGDRAAAASSRARTLRALAAFALCLCAMAIGLRDAPSPLRQRGRTHLRAARWLARHARGGLRLVAPFNAGAYLLYYATPAARLYIDPRNNLGAEALRDYLAMREDPRRFDAELLRTRADAVMVDIADGADAKIAAFLGARRRRFALSYFDGFYAIYAVSGASRAANLPRYAALRASTDPRYALAAGAPLERDLARLRREAPAAAAAITAYRDYARARRDSDRAGLARASVALARALPHLPPSEPLMLALAKCYLALGKPAAARQVLRVALRVFPASRALRQLAARLR